MSHNKSHSKAIAKWLKKAPAAIHSAGLKVAIFDVVRFTYQDSGNASFNWKVETEAGTATFDYLRGKGVEPVGDRYDYRTVSGQSDKTALARYKLAVPVLRRVRSGSLKRTQVVNVIPSDFYAQNAKLKQAEDRARKSTEAAMKEAFDKYMKEGPYGKSS